jgi:hypothetical protein
MQFHPNSDYQSVVRVFTPFMHPQPSAEEMKGILLKTIQSLRPLKYPTFCEVDYYLHCYACENVALKYTYAQVAEVVDLAAQCDRNFTVVAAKVKRAALNAIQCMESFDIFCVIKAVDASMGGAAANLQQEQKRANDVMLTFKQQVMQNSMLSPVVQDEFDYQCNQRDTEACFSPVRLIAERFDQMNEAVAGAAGTTFVQQPGNLVRTDFSNMVVVENKKAQKVHQYALQ